MPNSTVFSISGVRARSRSSSKSSLKENAAPQGKHAVATTQRTSGNNSYVELKLEKLLVWPKATEAPKSVEAEDATSIKLSVVCKSKVLLSLSKLPVGIDGVCVVDKVVQVPVSKQASQGTATYVQYAAN